MNSGFLVWVPARVQRLALRYPGGCLGIARPKPMTYCTSFARKRANSASLIDPAFFSRSSFSISSAALNPTTRRSSSCASRALLGIALGHASSLKNEISEHADVRALR